MNKDIEILSEFEKQFFGEDEPVNAVPRFLTPDKLKKCPEFINMAEDELLNFIPSLSEFCQILAHLSLANLIEEIDRKNSVNQSNIE